MRETLKKLDPAYYRQVDLKNMKRVAHAVEICIESGKPYSELRTATIKQRPFRIVKIGLTLPRQQLFDRINNRVCKMLDAGLVEEARRVYPKRHLNSLNTVGYKELFAWMDGEMEFDTAIARIQKTRAYTQKATDMVRERPRYPMACARRPCRHIAGCPLLPIGFNACEARQGKQKPTTSRCKPRKRRPSSPTCCPSPQAETQCRRRQNPSPRTRQMPCRHCRVRCSSQSRWST